jgi:hypothetical protein
VRCDRAVVQAALSCRGGVQWSKIELLWGLANYFKHRDEWSFNSRTNPQGRKKEKHTIPVIVAKGVKQLLCHDVCLSSGT